MRIIVIIVLLMFAMVLFKYRSSEKVQKIVVYALIITMIIYVSSVVVSELIH